MATCPAARLMMLEVMKNGDTRPGPRAWIWSCVSTIIPSPPIPEAMIVPVFSGSGTGPSPPIPAERMASSVAARA
jgi:hypothetical protein